MAGLCVFLVNTNPKPPLYNSRFLFEYDSCFVLCGVVAVGCCAPVIPDVYRRGATVASLSAPRFPTASCFWQDFKYFLGLVSPVHRSYVCGIVWTPKGQSVLEYGSSELSLLPPLKCHLSLWTACPG